MIFEAILNALLTVLKALFGWINIPGIGEEFDSAMQFIDVLFSNAQQLINLFLPWDIVRFGIPVIIIVKNFDHIYDFIMWILRKIPMLGIE